MHTNVTAPASTARGAFGPGRGVLVVGHGTADPVGAAETRRVADLVAEALPGVPVALGFLEVIRPTIADALADLADAGCREVVAAPLLLFEAGHAKRDLPEAIAEPAAALGVAVVRAGPLGCHPAIVELACRRRAEVVSGHEPVAAAETALVRVGRGSSDPTSPAQLAAFTEATLAAEPRPRFVLAGFVAAARPTVPEALAEAGAASGGGLRRIVVQPHLLFRGHVEEQVAAAVAAARAGRPELEWLTAPRLGPDPLVARAVVERAAEALAFASLRV
ncbi:MAG: sirohydrochlorin chelatase [Planctomycetota bacterium]